MDIPYYPLNDFGPLMKGLVIGGMGIFHVFLAQFAIGGGILMCYFQWLSQTGRFPLARSFVSGYFKFLVLLSFVLGALTGVGMWFTSIQISPRTIGTMVTEFHWVWATEWTFFCLEVVAGYAFYRYESVLKDSGKMKLLVLYSLAAWFSLFWINGILSWQLTPGGWTETQRVWSGFFNPSFWPSLFFRTVASLAIASLVACILINAMSSYSREDRRKLINKAALFMAPMVLMPLLGFWYFMTVPADSRSWVMGGSAAMTLFMSLAVGASMLIGLYAVVGLIVQRLYINGATATLLCALAFVASAGGEFVREGIRKPYTIRQELYSNSILEKEVAYLRRVGSVSGDPYPLKNSSEYPNDQVRLGVKVFRFQCSVCHTLNGANGLLHLAGTWSQEQKRFNIARLQHTKPFMPPFSGTAEELEGLVQYLTWEQEGRPETWELTEDPELLKTLGLWLEEAGTRPGIDRMAHVQSNGDQK